MPRKRNGQRLPRWRSSDNSFVDIHHFESFRRDFDEQVTLVAIGIEGFPIFFPSFGFFGFVAYQPRGSVNRHVSRTLTIEVIERHPWVAANFRDFAAKRIRG